MKTKKCAIIFSFRGKRDSSKNQKPVSVKCTGPYLIKCCKDTSRQDDGKGCPSPNSQENDQRNVQIGSTHKKLGIDAWKKTVLTGPD